MKNILYVLSVFPSTSATFVLNELLMLKDHGYKIFIVSLRKPKGEILHAGSELFEDVFYLPHHSNGASDILNLIKENLNLFIHHPLKYTIGLFDALSSGTLKFIYDFFRSSYLVKKLNSVEIFHIHAHFAHSPTTIARYLSYWMGNDYSFTCHAVDLFVKKNFHCFERKLRDAKFAITISQFNKDFLLNSISDKDLIKKVDIIRCGIDHDKFKRNGLDNNKSQINILSVGRFVEKKGFDYLIEALRILKNKRLNFNCKIIGDGPLFNSISEKIAEMKIKDSVHLLGAKDSSFILNELKKADLFVLPCVVAGNGDMDGIPVSIMEAMACEIPVVSTNISGIPELVSDEVEGLLVEQRNSEQLAEAIEKLILDHNLRARLGKNARSKIIKNFSLMENIKKLETLFLEKIQE
jgi:glycosyltransferase involved in cell wall biosynthesis